MNHTEMTYILTGAEIYALAAVKGISRIFGLFDAESFPDSRQLPTVLTGLARKGLVYQQDGRLVTDNGVDRLMSCYEDWERALAIYFADDDLPDICVISGGSGMLYSEGVLHQPGAVRMRLTDAEGVCAELEESGCLECVPACPPHSAEPAEPEDRDALQTFLTISTQSSRGESSQHGVLIGSSGCYISDGGELRYAHRAGVLALITGQLTGAQPENRDETTEQREEV